MMSMLWTLMILVNVSGAFSSDFKSIQLPMSSKEACLKAAQNLAEGSKGASFSCISSETGEVVKVK
jgi:hypothetical protein